MDIAAQLEELREIADSFSSDFAMYLDDKADNAALNWLRAYGIPQTPNDVWRIFSVLYSGIPALLVQDDKVALTEGAKGSEQEVAENKRKRETQAQLFDPAKFGGPVTSPGGYI